MEKDLTKVPKSKLMTSQDHVSATGIVGESVEEIRVVTSSFIVVMLTWVIKTATSQRRKMVASMSEKTAKKSVTSG